MPVLAAVVAVTLLVGGLLGLRALRVGGTGEAASPAAGASAVASEAPPLQVRLRDEGTALAVSWTGLRATVVVALSRDGAPAVVVASVPPDTTEYVVRDVDPAVEYCVVVGPLSDAASLSRATSVCTGRR